MRKNNFLNVLYILVLYLFPVGSQAAIGPNDIVTNNDRISIRVNQEPLDNIIGLLSQKTGAQIFIFDAAGKKHLTVEIVNKPFEAVLRSILKGVNYAIVYQDVKERGEVKWYKKSPNGEGATSWNNSSMQSLHNNPVASEVAEPRYFDKEKTENLSGFQNPTDQDSGVFEPVKDNNHGTAKNNGQTINNYYSDTETQSSDSLNKDVSVHLTEIETYRSGTSDLLTEEVSEQYDTEIQNDQTQAEVSNIKFRIEMLEEQINSGYADKHYDIWAPIKGEEYMTDADRQLADLKERLAKLTTN